MGRDDTLCAGEFNRLEMRPGGRFMVTPATRGYACFDLTPCSEWLPGPDSNQRHHLVNIDKPWRRIRTAAGVEDVRLHDPRRTIGSWLAQGGVDLNRIKDALRHAKIETTLIYERLADDAAKPVMEEHGRRILEAAGKHKPAEVVRLDRPK